MRVRAAQIALVIFLVASSVGVAVVGTVPSEPTIRVVPEISTGARGETYTVDINVADVTMENSINGVYGWEFDMSFNPDVLNLTSVMEGPWLKGGGETLFSTSIDNAAGTVIVTDFLYQYPATGVVGSGTLANVTFLVTTEGRCSLNLYYTLLRTYDGANILVVDHTAVSGFFSNFHDVAVTSVAPSATQVNVGDSVYIDVVAANEGDFNETFDVTTYWNIGSLSQVIETQSGIYLENGTSTSPPPTFTWDTTGSYAGNYTISAEAGAVAGEANITNNMYTDGQVMVNVPGAPSAIFTYSPETPSGGETVTFNSTSYDSDGWIVGWEWDLDGDGSVDATTENVTHTYTEARTYTAILYVTDNDGKKAFSYREVKVTTDPVAEFTYSPRKALVRQNVTFTSTSHDVDGEIVNYLWNLGDGTNATTESVTHTYTEARTYTVTLNVTDDDGLSDSITENVTVSTKHDVVVESITTDLQTYARGYGIDIEIVILNNGTETETFSATIYYNSTIIETFNVTDLAPADQVGENINTTKITWLGNYTKDLLPGKYNITAEVTLDTDEDSTNNWANTTITVNIVDVALKNIEVSSTVVLTNGLMNLSVIIENKGTGLASPTIAVWLTNTTGQFTGPDYGDVVILESATEETIQFPPWNATKDNFSPGIYNLSANLELRGEPAAVQLDNPFSFGEITLGSSLITIFATPEDITYGSSITINGSITPLRRNVEVTLHHRAGGNGTWSLLEVVTTDENGTYSYAWTPEATGTFQIKASWEGDNKALPTESETLTLTVGPAAPILLYALAGVAAGAAIIGAAIYFLKIRKPKSA